MISDMGKYDREFIYLFIYLFICLFIYLFIYLMLFGTLKHNSSSLVTTNH